MDDSTDCTDVDAETARALELSMSEAIRAARVAEREGVTFAEAVRLLRKGQHTGPLWLHRLTSQEAEIIARVRELGRGVDAATGAKLQSLTVSLGAEQALNLQMSWLLAPGLEMLETKTPGGAGPSGAAG